MPLCVRHAIIVLAAMLATGLADPADAMRRRMHSGSRLWRPAPRVRRSWRLSRSTISGSRFMMRMAGSCARRSPADKPDMKRPPASTASFRKRRSTTPTCTMTLPCPSCSASPGRASRSQFRLARHENLVGPKTLAIENDIRGLLRNFGLKVGIVGVVGFEQRIHDLVEGVPELADIMEPLLAARRVLREKFAKLHRKVLLLARDNEVCQRLMTIPGVGPVVSLAFISTVDVPARFRNSKAVGPSLGLTPVLNQSGESHRVGRISLCGDEAMRALLYEAAQVMLTRVQKWSWLKAWAMNIAKRRGQKKAIVALARRLAVIMHRMWSDGTEFRWTREMAPTI